MNTINHPPHYGGDTQTEPIKVIEAWGLNFHLGNAVKYIARAGKKGSEEEDLRKAVWYIQRHIDRLVGFADADEKVSARDFDDFGKFVDNFLHPTETGAPTEAVEPKPNDLKSQYVDKVNEFFHDQRVRDLMIERWDGRPFDGGSREWLLRTFNTWCDLPEGEEFWLSVEQHPFPEAKIKELKGWD
jgi:hypothetical protein